MKHRPRYALGLLALALIGAACSSDTVTSVTTAPSAAIADEFGSDGNLVAPDVGGKEFLVQVIVTDEGFEPSTIHLPAGRHVRLVLRNQGSTEHHFRVEGLIPAEVRWLLEPDLDISQIDAMTDDELAQAGLANENTEDADEMVHILHHLAPTFVPYKDESPSGIKPLFNEVHGYVTLGNQDTLTFFPLTTGRFKVEDVLHPENTGTVVVYLPEGVEAVG